MKLYTYWRSTTSYRLRIAFALKGLGYEAVPVNLLAHEQHTDDYATLNPGRGVPALVLDDGTVLTQSMAILEWLEETHPHPAFLPTTAETRAKVRAAALVIATDIHPVNNLRIISRLQAMGHEAEETVRWMNDWMTRGFEAVQALIACDTPFCFGDTPSLTDICLIPQLYNAHRWGCDMSPFRRLTDIETRCLALPAFEAAHPTNQADKT